MLREVHANKLKQRRKGLPDAKVLVPPRFVVIPGLKRKPTATNDSTENQNTQHAPISTDKRRESTSTASSFSLPAAARARTPSARSVSAEALSPTTRPAIRLTIPLEHNTLNKPTNKRRSSFRVQPSLSRQRRDPSVAPPITPQKRQLDVDETEQIALQSSTQQTTQIETSPVASPVASPARSTASQLDQQQQNLSPSSVRSSKRVSSRKTAGSVASRHSSVRKSPVDEAREPLSPANGVNDTAIRHESDTQREDIEMTEQVAIDVRDIKKNKADETTSEDHLSVHEENLQYISSQQQKEQQASLTLVAEQQLEDSPHDAAEQTQKGQEAGATLVEEQQLEDNDHDATGQALEKDVDKTGEMEKPVEEEQERDSAAKDIVATEEVDVGKEITVTKEVTSAEEAATAEEVTTTNEAKEVTITNEVSAAAVDGVVTEEVVTEEAAAGAAIEEDIDMAEAEKSPTPIMQPQQEEEREEEAATTDVQQDHTNSREVCPTASTPKEKSPVAAEREKSTEVVAENQETQAEVTQQQEQQERFSPIPGITDVDTDDQIDYNNYDYNDFGEDQNDLNAEEQSVNLGEVDSEVARRRQAIQDEYGQIDDEELLKMMQSLEERATITHRFKVIKLANLHLEALNMITTEAMVEAKRTFNDPFATSISGDYHGKVISTYAKRHQAYLEYIRLSTGLDRLKRIEKEYSNKKFQTEVERRTVKTDSDQLRKEIAAFDEEKKELTELDDFLGSVRALL